MIFFALATPLLVVWLVAVSIPDVMHARYRHQLWHLRDAIVDDLISGELTLSPAARRLLGSLYASIEGASAHTLRDGLIAYWSLCGATANSIDSVDAVVLGSDDINRKERERLAEYLSRYREVGVSHLMFGSPSGWIGTPLLVIWALSRRRENVFGHVANAEIVESVVRKPNAQSGQFAFR